MSAGFGGYIPHLARRFLASIWPGGPSQSDTEWATAHLLVSERLLWHSMGDADQRHAMAVAKRVARTLGTDATRPVIAAALLHDVGKTAAGLGTFGRVLATTLAALAGRG